MVKPTDSGGLSAEVFVPVHDEDAMRGFLLQALRANTEAVGQLREQSDKRDGKIDNLIDTMHSIDKRIAIIETNSLERDIKEIRVDMDLALIRLTALEASENQRKGAFGLFEWLKSSWPAILGFGAVILLIVERTRGGF